MKSIPFPMQYRHPLWQKFRLKVLEKKGFSCQICDSKDDQLHVHHGYYEKGKMLWEHPMETMWVLCDRCHKESHSLLDEIKQDIGLTHPGLLPVLEIVASTIANTQRPNALSSLEAAKSQFCTVVKMFKEGSEV